MNTQANSMRDAILNILDDMKAIDVETLDVHSLTTMTDYMIICTGRSSRHVKSIADNVMRKMKEQKMASIGSEGEKVSEWILIDFADVIVHVMQADTREYYKLEKLWGPENIDSQQA